MSLVRGLPARWRSSAGRRVDADDGLVAGVVLALGLERGRNGLAVLAAESRVIPVSRRSSHIIKDTRRLTLQGTGG
jgi:hypothetical protein